jgi:putative methionine-R-sulfoxide reductase with GAF domain
VDSHRLNDFDAIDQEALMKVAQIVERCLA